MEQNFDIDDVASSNAGNVVLHQLGQAILAKNTKLMAQILRLMFRAEKAKGKAISLTLKDIGQLEKLMVSPKDLYLIVARNIAKDLQLRSLK